MKTIFTTDWSSFWRTMGSVSDYESFVLFLFVCAWFASYRTTRKLDSTTGVSFAFPALMFLGYGIETAYKLFVNLDVHVLGYGALTLLSFLNLRTLFRLKKVESEARYALDQERRRDFLMGGGRKRRRHVHEHGHEHAHEHSHEHHRHDRRGGSSSSGGSEANGAQAPKFQDPLSGSEESPSRTKETIDP